MFIGFLPSLFFYFLASATNDTYHNYILYGILLGLVVSIGMAEFEVVRRGHTEYALWIWYLIGGQLVLFTILVVILRRSPLLTMIIYLSIGYFPTLNLQMVRNLAVYRTEVTGKIDGNELVLQITYCRYFGHRTREYRIPRSAQITVINGSKKHVFVSLYHYFLLLRVEDTGEIIPLLPSFSRGLHVLQRLKAIFVGTTCEFDYTDASSFQHMYRTYNHLFPQPYLLGKTKRAEQREQLDKPGQYQVETGSYQQIEQFSNQNEMHLINPMSTSKIVHTLVVASLWIMGEGLAGLILTFFLYMDIRDGFDSIGYASAVGLVLVIPRMIQLICKDIYTAIIFLIGKNRLLTSSEEIQIFSKLGPLNSERLHIPLLLRPYYVPTGSRVMLCFQDFNLAYSVPVASID